MKTALLSLLTLLTFNLLAQEFPYEFTVLSEDYVELTDDISLTEGEIWDDPDLVIPLGFEFNYFGNISTLLYIEYDISFGAMLSTSILKDYSTKIILPFESDIIDGGELTGESESTISYKVEGETPNRICKIQWDNCAFYNEVDDFGTAEDRVNFQVWVYEGSNDIEFRYGSMSVENPVNIETDGPLIGLVGGVNLTSDFVTDCFLLTEDPADPEITTFTSVEEIFTAALLNDVPSEGTVYRFGSTFVGIDEADILMNYDSKVYPTLFTDQITVESESNSEYRIQNIAGQIVDEGILPSNKTVLATGNYQSGLYFIRLENELGVKTHRLVKK